MNLAHFSLAGGISLFDGFACPLSIRNSDTTVTRFHNRMQRAAGIARSAVTFPGVVFWLAFVAVSAGLFSSLVFHYLYRSRQLLNVVAPLAERQCGTLLRSGFLLSAVPMCFCGVLAQRFFRRLRSPFLVLLSASQILSVFSMAMMLYFQGAVHVFAEFFSSSRPSHTHQSTRPPYPFPASHSLSNKSAFA
jgi:hypothetical protein